MNMVIDRASSRGHANHGWLETWHTFSFADYYNPARMHFGMLRVLNDDIIHPRTGFDTHPHKNMEVITVPLKGTLRHGDSLNNSHVIRRGEIQIMSAGTGIHHSEHNADDRENLELLQIWVFPSETNTEPKYADYDIKPLLKHNEISTFIAPGTAIALNQDAWFSWGKLDAGITRDYLLKGKNTGVYLFVVEGEISLNDTVFHRRDGVGITDASSLEIKALSNSEIILMEVPV